MYKYENYLEPVSYLHHDYGTSNNSAQGANML
jgi:hypothetical protein